MDEPQPDPNVVHVLPTNDLMAHENVGDQCACGPTAEPVKRDDGSMGWVMVHHSLDGRENREKDPVLVALDKARADFRDKQQKRELARTMAIEAKRVALQAKADERMARARYVKALRAARGH